MHIPDGYLSPQTYLPLFGGTLACWSVALGKMETQLAARQIPYLAMATAFSFLILMFNLPIPGGTTGHEVPGPGLPPAGGALPLPEPVPGVTGLHQAGKTVVIITRGLQLVRLLLPQVVVLAEDHQLAELGPASEILGNTELLARVNLIHRPA